MSQTVPTAPSQTHIAAREGRPLSCDLPLINRVIAYSVKVNFMEDQDWLPDPFYAVIKILRFAGVPSIQHTQVIAPASGVNAHTNVSLWDPLFSGSTTSRIVDID